MLCHASEVVLAYGPGVWFGGMVRGNMSRLRKFSIALLAAILLVCFVCALMALIGPSIDTTSEPGIGGDDDRTAEPAAAIIMPALTTPSALGVPAHPRAISMP